VCRSLANVGKTAGTVTTWYVADLEVSITPPLDLGLQCGVIEEYESLAVHQARPAGTSARET